MTGLMTGSQTIVRDSYIRRDKYWKLTFAENSQNVTYLVGSEASESSVAC